MVVASGQVPYTYVQSVGNEHNWRIPAGTVIAPSGGLFEEAMYVLEAEYNKIVADDTGFKQMSIIAGNGEDSDPSVLVNFSKQGGRFIKIVNNDAFGFFKPDPSGRTLTGEIPPSSGNNAVALNSPAIVSQQDTVLEMREVLRQVFQVIALNSNVDNLEMAQDWLRIRKNYRDGYSASGLFYEETGTVNQLFDGPGIDGFGINLKTEILNTLDDAGVLASGLTDRHLDEVRFQIVPYISGTNGLVADGVISKDAQDTIPIKPTYMRTDGTLAPFWNARADYGNDEVTIFGMNLEPGSRILASGGGTGYGNNEYYFDINPAGGNGQSGVFASGQSMSSGWYKLLLMHDGSTDVSGVYHSGVRAGHWPHNDYYAGNVDFIGSQQNPEGFVISDTIFANEQNQWNGIPVWESGLWYSYPGQAMSGVRDIDFFAPRDGASGATTFSFAVWGNPFGFHTHLGGAWLSQGWVADTGVNNDIYRVHVSGVGASLPQDESGCYSKWDYGLGLIYQAHDFMGSGVNGTWPDSTPKEERITSPKAVTIDGANFIVTAEWIEMSGAGGASNERFGPSGAYFKMNSSWVPLDVVIPDPALGSVPSVRKIGSEFIGSVITSDTIGWGWSNGRYSVETITFAGDWRGSHSRSVYTMQWGQPASGALNVVESGNMRLADFWQDEETSKIYCWFVANPAGQSGTANKHRYIGVVATGGGHPWTISEIYSLGDDVHTIGNDLSHTHWCQSFKY